MVVCMFVFGMLVDVNRIEMCFSLVFVLVRWLIV